MGGLENGQRTYFTKLNVTALQIATANFLHTVEFFQKLVVAQLVRYF
jgi:hypothetical protein